MEKNNTHWNRPLLAGLLGSGLYFAWCWFFIGLRAEHIGLYALVVTLYFAHAASRRFVLAFTAFLIYWVIYDSLRVWPNFTVNPVHIAEPYFWEKSWFGIAQPDGQALTPNEYFHAHPSTALDIISGLFYLNWIPVPLLFAFYLFLYHKPLFLRFSYGFLFTNLIGFVIYYSYPAAPPWYIEQHGFNLIHGTPGNAAGLLRFDAYFGIRLFSGLYQKNASVFAAIPSLHSAYPVLCLLNALPLRKTWLTVLFAVFAGGIWFAAVYTRHHYIIDVLAGIAVALAGFYLFEYLSSRTRLKGWMEMIGRNI